MARYYGDEDVPVLVARIARSLDIDIVHTEELGRKGATDEDQLRFAAQVGRILLTRNCKDFWPMTFRFNAEGQTHAGVLCITKSLEDLSASVIARALMQFDSDHADGVPAYFLDYLHPLSPLS